MTHCSNELKHILLCITNSWHLLKWVATSLLYFHLSTGTPVSKVLYPKAAVLGTSSLVLHVQSNRVKFTSPTINWAFYEALNICLSRFIKTVRELQIKLGTALCDSTEMDCIMLRFVQRDCQHISSVLLLFAIYQFVTNKYLQLVNWSLLRHHYRDWRLQWIPFGD